MKLATFFKRLYINDRFYWLISLLAAGFLGSFWMPLLFNLVFYATILLGFIFVMDAILMFRFRNPIKANRNLSKKLSNSDNNLISIDLSNYYPFDVFMEVIDELPAQFQKRDFYLRCKLQSKSDTKLNYTVLPLERGEYIFGNLNVYVHSKLGLVKRHFVFNADERIPVYPSFIQMRQYEFLAFNNKIAQFGLKKNRAIGHSLEFEQIKNYVAGDDYRTINWKATAKHAQLMANQFQDEKSQPIYALIDTGRTMKMPFEGLKLLDYAINSALAFANITLLKKDKAGLICFSKKVEISLKASHKKIQLQLINESLYKLTTQYKEADYGFLYAFAKRQITQRSLLILYTNFEHITALKRQLPFLQALSKQHLLVVVFFENTELDNLLQQHAEDLESIYHQTIAQKFALEKRHMQLELKRSGIYSILSKPKNLTVNVINKYLEFKSRGLI